MSMPENKQDDAGAAVEALLRQAAPRAAPPAEDERRVREAVMAEWQSVVNVRKTRVSRVIAAIAASLVIAVALPLANWKFTDTKAIDVASIDKRSGTVYLAGNNAEKKELTATGNVQSGQVIETGKNSALGLAWGTGGSLRLDQDTLIEFVDAKTVFLHRGQIYFDSLSVDSNAQLLVDTMHGSVRHIGTQYLASVGDRELVVSVREGSVKIDGRYYNETANRGRQVQLRGSMRPMVVDLAANSNAWMWTEALSPGINLDNRSVLDFLQWVGRETGHEIVFESTIAERLATDSVLVGSVQADPRTELRLRMLTTDLDYLIDADSGTINVRLADQGQP